MLTSVGFASSRASTPGARRPSSASSSVAPRRRISRIAGSPPPLSLTFPPPNPSRALATLPCVHREPKKKTKGQNKTYYHVKDINFLAHEPLLEKFRALRAYERKIKKAKAKKAHHAVDRLEERKPQYGLDHLVKERYPSFVDAIRDLDDPLTLVHLFALLPADKRHGIPAEVVNRSRALAPSFNPTSPRRTACAKCSSPSRASTTRRAFTARR